MEDPPRLEVHEWLAVTLFISIFASILIVTSIFPKKVPEEAWKMVEESQNREIEVTIVGAVQKPGRYRLPQNATLKEAIALAELLPTADLRRVKVDRKLRNKQVIKIPVKKINAKKNQEVQKRKKEN